jgi:hypothetical protein
MKEKFCFVSLAFGAQYIAQLARLKESVRTIYDDVEIFSWINTYPQGSKTHKESNYGFKVHAVNHARDHGYDKIIWLDTAIVLKREVDEWFGLTTDYGIVAAADDNLLINTCSDKAFEYFQVDKSYSEAAKQRLCGGSVFIFDFTSDWCCEIFETWERAERDGMFNAQGEPKHRHDEACLSHSLYINGSSPVPYGDCFYNNVPHPIVTKHHFK